MSIWQARGFTEPTINFENIQEFSKPAGATYQFFRTIKQRAGNYVLKGSIWYFNHGRPIEDSEIVLEVIGTNRNKNETEVFYKRAEFLDTAQSSIEFNLSDITIHHGLSYTVYLTISGQAVSINFKDITLRRINRAFNHAVGSSNSLCKLGRRDSVTMSQRQEILEFNNGLTPEIKDGLEFYPQTRQWFGDRNLNHSLESGYVHPETRYFLSERIGQTSRHRTLVFRRERPLEIHTFTVKSERRPIFIKAGSIGTNQHFNYRVSGNGTREIKLLISQSDILLNSPPALILGVTIIASIPVFKDSAMTEELGSVRISIRHD